MVPAAAMQLASKMPSLRRTQSSSGGSGSSATFWAADAVSPNLPLQIAPHVVHAPPNNYIEVSAGPLQVNLIQS